MFLYISNHTSPAVKTIEKPSTLETIEPIPKEEREAWASNPRTRHYFLSGFEGAMSGTRINKNNPAVKLHAIIADYDSEDISDEMLEEASRSGVASTWATRSMTPGRARLIWELDEPVWIPNTAKAAKQVMERIGVELGLEGRLPKFDPSSLKTTQYFEMGREWKETGPKLPAEVVGAWVLDTAEKMNRYWGDSANIPIADVAAEVAEKHPGRWPGEFVVGSRGPLFWIDDGIDRPGCRVGDHGMICYSTRAEGPFLPWSKILGVEFVKKWETNRIGTVANNIWYDRKSYWWKTESGWIDRNKDDSIMHLKSIGFSSKISGKETICEAEKVLVSVQTCRTVDYAAPILFEANDICDVRGDAVLNISRRSVMEPADSGDPERFPWLYEFLNNIWDPYEQDGVPQRDYFLAWLKRMWETSLNNRPSQGHLLVVAGRPSHGKTFMSRCIIGTLMGGSVDASDILQGTTKFIKQAAEVAVWAIDDATSMSTHAAMVKFGENLKKQVANPTVMYQPKYKDALELPWKGRIVLTCNTDPDSLAIIPPMDNTVADKVMLLRCSETWSPSFLKSNWENEERVRNELPFFLKWLLDWKVPDAIVDPTNPRFGIKAIHHPTLRSAAREASSAHSTQEALELWREAYLEVCGEDYLWKGSATALLAHITNSVPHVAAMLRQTNPRWFGKDLRKLMGVWEPLKKVTNCGGISHYTIDVRSLQ